MRNQTINLNLIPTGVMPVVHLSQYDQDVDGSLIFNIYNGPVPYDLTGCVAHIQGSKPDGTVFDYQCTVYTTYVTSATQYQMTTVAGTYEAELRITNGNNTVGTINFQFAIEECTTAHTDLSDTDLPDLMDEINEDVNTTGQNANRAETAADEAEESEENAEAWAVGERGGVPVTSGDDTYENNSKYYATQAVGDAEDAEAYAVGKRNGVDVTSGDPAYENNSKYYAAQSDTRAEDSEAYAIGKRNGVDVTSGDPAYENNSKYYSEQIGDEVEDAEAWAKGTRSGVPVTSGDPEYENNSYYHSQQSEAWADGQINGVDVPNTHPAYHNNAKYWSDQAAQQTIGGLSDVSISSVQNNDVLHFNSTSTKWENTNPADIVPIMTGATSGTAGVKGLVPAPAAGDQAKYLQGDGTWATVDLSSKADQSVIGSSYNASTAYTPGDRFTYNGKRYKVTITSGTVQGQTPPNANYYEECSVDDDIIALNNSLTDWIDITSSITSSLTWGIKKAIYNKATKEVKFCGSLTQTITNVTTIMNVNNYSPNKNLLALSGSNYIIGRFSCRFASSWTESTPTFWGTLSITNSNDIIAYFPLSPSGNYAYGLYTEISYISN